jgi:hypothetical protein
MSNLATTTISNKRKRIVNYEITFSTTTWRKNNPYFDRNVRELAKEREIELNRTKFWQKLFSKIQSDIKREIKHS